MQRTSTELMPESQMTRIPLLKSLKGRRLYIPDIQVLFSHWPQHINPELELLREDIDKKLQKYAYHILLVLTVSELTLTSKSLFPQGQRLRKMKAADAALFGASWWPYPSIERLRIATYLSIWVCQGSSALAHALLFS